MAEGNLKKIGNYTYNPKIKLGKGQFASVYKGRNEDTEEIVAIKVIKKSLLEQESYLMNTILQEISIMKILDSDYVVRCLDILETNNNYYLVQEYCDQGDFRAYLRKKKILQEEEAKYVLRNILSGFLDLLKYGIIHRDLKPENILIQTNKNDPQVSIYKLADFGFARTVDNFRRQMLDSLVGTPLYMSPQILMYEKYTSKSDIWSIGLIFYEMLYGCTPWGVTNQYQLLKDIKNIPVQFQVNGIVNISQEAINFIYKCLQIEENSRISWDEIYRHNLFGNYFSKFLQKTYQLENKAMYLINNLRQKIHKTNTDLMELFQNFELTEDSKLNMKSFESLMRQIDPQLTREEIEYIFNKFDGDEDNKIDFNEFTKWLKNNNIRMSTHENAQQKRKDLQKFQDLNLQIQLQEEEEKRNFQSQSKNKSSQKNMNIENTESLFNKLKTVEEKANYMAERLAVYVDYYKVDIKLLFNKFNNSQDENKKLCYQDFKYLVQKTAEFLSDEIISQVFKKFDKDRDSFICFNEFKETMKELILKVQSNPNISQF